MFVSSSEHDKRYHRILILQINIWFHIASEIVYLGFKILKSGFQSKKWFLWNSGRWFQKWCQFILIFRQFFNCFAILAIFLYFFKYFFILQPNYQFWWFLGRCFFKSVLNDVCFVFQCRICTANMPCITLDMIVYTKPELKIYPADYYLLRLWYFSNFDTCRNLEFQNKRISTFNS